MSDARLEDQTTAGEIVAAVAKAVHAKDYKGEPCPPDRIPKLEQLFLWLFNDADVEVRQTVYQECYTVIRHAATVETNTLTFIMFLQARTIKNFPASLTDDDRKIFEDFGSQIGIAPKMAVEEIHRIWCQTLKSKYDYRHPFTEGVREWQNQPPVVKRNSRPDPIFPTWQNVPRHDLRTEQSTLFPSLPTRTGYQAAQPGLFSSLPDIENPLASNKIIPPSLPLVSYDAAGGIGLNKGGGAPLALRLWVEAILSVKMEDREQKARLEITLGELILALWPQDWSGPKRDGPRLEKAFNAIGRMFVPWEKGRWLAVVIRNRPHYYDRDSLVVIDVELPPGTRPGPIVYRPMLAKYGVSNTAAFRLALSLPAYWNKYLTFSHKNQKGHIHYNQIPPLIPKVKRNKAGFVLDARSVTEEEAEKEKVNEILLHGKDGKPFTHWNDKRAWTGEMERNPELLKRLRGLEPNDLLEAGASLHERTLSARRKTLEDVRKGLQLMRQGNDLTLIEKGRLVIPIPPDWWWKFDAQDGDA